MPPSESEDGPLGVSPRKRPRGIRRVYIVCSSWAPVIDVGKRSAEYNSTGDFVSLRHQCAVVLVSVVTSPGLWTIGTAKLCVLEAYLAETVERIEETTVDAILNWASRSVMPWRLAIQAKSE